MRGVSQGRLGHQTARVDGPKRHTGADGAVDRGVELRLVVHAIQPQAAGKVDQRFLLAELPQHFGGGLQRGQLPVGVEDVELAVVLTKRRSGVGSAGIVRDSSKSLAFSHDHGFDDAQQPVAVIREILKHVDGAARISQDGNEVRRSHLRPDELLRRGQRAHLVRGRHGGHVEIQRQQAAVLVSEVPRRFGRDVVLAS